MCGAKPEQTLPSNHEIVYESLHFNNIKNENLVNESKQTLTHLFLHNRIASVGGKTVGVFRRNNITQIFTHIKLFQVTLCKSLAICSISHWCYMKSIWGLTVLDCLMVSVYNFLTLLFLHLQTRLQSLSRPRPPWSALCLCPALRRTLERSSYANWVSEPFVTNHDADASAVRCAQNF